MRMVEEQLLPRGIKDPNIIEAMQTVPRHLFVDDALYGRAYADHPLPIGGGQTISQPYIVAAMTQALQLEGGERVLEVGTGSGYQAAILSRICGQVYTVERVNSLLSRARQVFDRLHYYNIRSKLDDGSAGWAKYQPFDAIIVTAGGPQVPQPLVEQLRVGGRMVIPVGDQSLQQLQLVEKEAEAVKITTLETVRFVPLLGAHAWNE